MMKLHLLLLTIATLTSNLGHAACPPAAINYAEAKKQENEKLLALKLAQSENKETTAIRRENGILTALGLPKVLQQLINEYCYSPLEFFRYLYTQPILPNHIDPIAEIKLSAYGKTIAASATDKAVETLAIAFQKDAATLTGHTAKILAMALSTKGKIIVSGSVEGTIKIWDIDTKICIATFLTNHTARVTAIALSTDGKMIVSASDDTTIKIWDIATQKCIATLPSNSYYTMAIGLSPDDKTIFPTSSDCHFTIKIWDITTQMCTGVLQHTATIKAGTLSTDGKILVSASEDKTIRIWDIATKSCTATLRDTNTPVVIALSIDNQSIITGLINGIIKIWDIGTKNCTAALSGHSDWINALALSPDGITVVSGSNDKTIKIWDIATKTCTATLPTRTDATRAIALSTDCKAIFSSEDKNIEIYQCNQSLLNSLMHLPHEQLICLKLIINLLNNIEITCDTKHAAHYADLMQQTWATLPKPLQQNFNHYFSESNVPSIITAWLDKKLQEERRLNRSPADLGCIIL